MSEDNYAAGEPPRCLPDQLNRICDTCKALVKAAWDPLPGSSSHVREYLFRLQDTSSGGTKEHEQALSHDEVSSYFRLDNSADSFYSRFSLAIERCELRPIFHSNLGELRHSSEAGSHLCTTIWTSIEDEFKEISQELDQIPDEALRLVEVLPVVCEAAIHSYGQAPYQMQIWLCFLGDISKKLAQECHLSLVSDRKRSPDGVSFEAVDPSPTTRPGTISQLSDWIKKCGERHHDCSHRAPARSLGGAEWRGPRRLLRIVHDEVEDRTLVTLVETIAFAPSLEYATLSHCWGGEVDMKLTRGTYLELEQGVNLETLPRTFREAMIVCESLKINFIWIDALCIVQDDRSDWLQESGQMGMIYAGSIVNIAATYAENCHGGLFDQVKNPLAFNHPILEIDWRGACELRGNFAFLEWFKWSLKVNYAPLNQRGWVFQEGILSPRVIHFCSDQIRWRCGSVQGCETLPVITLEEPYWREPVHAFDAQDWMWLVYQYKRRKFTKLEDALVAFAGIALQYGDQQRYQASDYLAGIWRTALPQQLLWIPEGKQVRLKDVAPSWSWASLSGDISWSYSLSAGFQEVHVHPQFSIVQFRSNESGGSALLEPRAAVLHVRGVLHPVSLDNLTVSTMRDLYLDEPAPKYFNVLRVRPGRQLTSCWRLPDDLVYAVGRSPATPAHSGEARVCQRDHFHATLDMLNADVDVVSSSYFLPLISLHLLSSRSISPCSHDGVYGLLLARTNEKGTFRRIGTVQLGAEIMGTELELPPEWHQGNLNLQPDDYLASNGRGSYEIRLI